MNEIERDVQQRKPMKPKTGYLERSINLINL